MLSVGRNGWRIRQNGRQMLRPCCCSSSADRAASGVYHKGNAMPHRLVASKNAVPAPRHTGSPAPSTAPTAHRHWQPTASDDALEPAPVLVPGADISVTGAVLTRYGLLAQSMETANWRNKLQPASTAATEGNSPNLILRYRSRPSSSRPAQSDRVFWLIRCRSIQAANRRQHC